MGKHLSTAEQAELQAALCARRSALDVQRRGRLAGKSRADHAREVLLQDGDDATQRDAEREVDLAMSDRDMVEISEIDAALRRLDAGGYGVCVDCGNAIPLARLRLEPQALCCVACAEQRERGAARPASM